MYFLHDSCFSYAKFSYEVLYSVLFLPVYSTGRVDRVARYLRAK